MDTIVTKEEAEKALIQLQRAAHRMKIMVQCGYYCTSYSEEDWEKFLAGDLWKSHYKALHYPDILEQYVLRYASYPFADGNLRSVAAVDHVRSQYIVLSIGHDSRGLDNVQIDVHIAIENERVILYIYNGDGDLYEDLEALGIARCDLVDG